MKSRALLFLTICGLAVLPACNQSPSDLPTLTINQPRGGEVVELGTPMTVSWTCAGCEAILGTRGVAVYASGTIFGDARVARVPIGLGGPTDSFVWTAGETLNGSRRLLNPGTYRLVLETFQEATKPLSATSGPFQLVVTIR